MIRTVTITSEEDLQQSWSDPSCPNLGWTFLESTLEECLQDDGTYVASYETLEVEEGKDVCFTYLSVEGEQTYHLPPGEYGVKPK